MSEKKPRINKNILIAVDESENARRAVSYVGQLLGGLSGFKVKLLHVIADPEEDYFPDPQEREKWLARTKEKVETMLAKYRQLLIDQGFSQNDVSVHSILRYCPSMAECILSERDKTCCDTIVVGRQGVSRKEEFLFGSISNKIVHHARDFSVWVVH